MQVTPLLTWRPFPSWGIGRDGPRDPLFFDLSFSTASPTPRSTTLHLICLEVGSKDSCLSLTATCSSLTATCSWLVEDPDLTVSSLSHLSPWIQLQPGHLLTSMRLTLRVRIWRLMSTL